MKIWDMSEIQVEDKLIWKIERSCNRLCSYAKDIMQKKYDNVKEILDVYKDYY